MKNYCFRFARAVAMLPLIVSGCATQGEPGSARAEAASAPQSVAVAPHAAKPVSQIPPPSAAETQYGIQIAHVGLTAADGMVDVRFKVLDAAKVRKLLGNAAHAPMLIAGDKPPLMPPHHALKGAKFAQGQIFYILYPNARNAVKPGVEVTVAMGEARLGPVTVQ